ncbi:pentapeptide repeat-containing protein [Verrucomicrobiales bacterium]|nr:pentapeptide repeat-containing protein [Verrucomicrobiales bacterium]
MKKPIIFSILFFILTAISSFADKEFGFGRGLFGIEEDPESGLRTGKIEVGGEFGEFGELAIYEIKPNAELKNLRLCETDLSNVDLRGADLTGTEFLNCNLKGVNLDGANLKDTGFFGSSSGEIKGTPINLDRYKLINGFIVGYGVNLRDANLKGVNFQGADVRNITFAGANLEGINFLNRDFDGSSFNGSNLKNAILTGANLSFCNLVEAKLEGTNLEGADLGQTSLYRIRGINIIGNPKVMPEGFSIVDGFIIGPNVDLSFANLQGIVLENLNLWGALLSQANLSEAVLKKVNLSEANLESALLKQANIIEVQLSKTNLRGANLEGAILKNPQLDGANLSEIKLNETKFEEITRDSIDLQNWSEINTIKNQIAEGGIGGGISPEQAAAITSNTESVNEVRNAIFIGGSSIIPALLTNDQEQRNSITANTTKIDELDGILTTADETLEAFSENIDTLNENDQILNANDESITEQMATLSENDQSIMAEINAMKAQLQTLVAQVAEKDQRIAELEQGGEGQSLEQVLEQVRDARAGSVVLTVDPDGDNITLGLTIEQSDNLIEWTKLDGEMTRTIPIPDGKKFYRFALDK